VRQQKKTTVQNALAYRDEAKMAYSQKVLIGLEDCEKKNQTLLSSFN
jgi:hypothetical protein